MGGAVRDLLHSVAEVQKEILVDIRSPHEKIDYNLTTHPPKNALVSARFDAVTALTKEFAHAMEDILPDGREKSVVHTKIEEASMWAKAAVARGNDNQ